MPTPFGYRPFVASAQCSATVGVPSKLSQSRSGSSRLRLIRPEYRACQLPLSVGKVTGRDATHVQEAHRLQSSRQQDHNEPRPDPGSSQDVEIERHGDRRRRGAGRWPDRAVGLPAPTVVQHRAACTARPRRQLPPRQTAQRGHGRTRRRRRAQAGQRGRSHHRRPADGEPRRRRESARRHGMPLPNVPASAWVIANASTGQVLAAKDPHGEFGPASTLKVLTAITLIPLLNPNAMVDHEQAGRLAAAEHRRAHSGPRLQGLRPVPCAAADLGQRRGGRAHRGHRARSRRAWR